MELIWIVCVCLSASVVELSGLLTVNREESKTETLISLSRQELEERKWPETQNIIIVTGIPRQYDSKVSNGAIYHGIRNAMLSPSFSSLTPYTILNTEHYNGIFEAYLNDGKYKWQPDNSDIFGEISRYNETLTEFGDILKPSLAETLYGIYKDIPKIPSWIERNVIQDINSRNNIDVTISDQYQKTSTGGVVQFDKILQSKVIDNQLNFGLPHVTVMNSFPTEWSFGRVLTSTDDNTRGQSQHLYKHTASSSSTFYESPEPMKTYLPILTPYHETMKTDRTTLLYSISDVIPSNRWLFPFEVTNHLQSQDQIYEIFETKKGEIEANLVTGLWQPEATSSIASIKSSTTVIKSQVSSQVLPPPAPETMSAGIHQLGHFLETIIQSSFSYEQYQFMEDTPNLRSSQKPLPIVLFTGQSLPKIQSSMPSFASLSTPRASQADISTSLPPPPPPEIAADGTYLFDLSEDTTKTRFASVEQYQFIENTLTFDSSLNILRNGLSWPETLGSMNIIHSSTTSAQYPSNSAIFPLRHPQTKTNDTHELGHNVLSIISSASPAQFQSNTSILTSWSSFIQNHSIENMPSFWSAQEIFSSNVLETESQPDGQSKMTIINSSSAQAHYQTNTSILVATPLTKIIHGTHILGLSLLTITTSSASLGQYKPMDNDPNIKPFQGTLSDSFFPVIMEPQIPSITIGITTISIHYRSPKERSVLPSHPPETISADTDSFGLSLNISITSMSSFDQYLSIDNTLTLRSSHDNLSTRLFIGQSQPDVQSIFTSINTLSSPIHLTVNTSMLHSSPPAIITAGIINKVESYQETIIPSSFSFGQHKFIEISPALRSTHEPLLNNLFAGVSQTEYGSSMASITPVSAQFPVSTPLLITHPSYTMIAGTQRFVNALKTININSSFFEQYQSIGNKPIFMPSLLESMTTSAHTLELFLMTMITSSLSLGDYQCTENVISLRPLQETLSTFLEVDIQSSVTSFLTPSMFEGNTTLLPLKTTLGRISPSGPSPSILVTGSHQSPSPTHVLARIEASTLVSMEIISNVSVSNTTRLSTLESHSNTIQQYYFIYPSTGPIQSTLKDIRDNLPQSSASSFPSRPIVLPSATSTEYKASEERMDRSSTTTHATSEVTHRPSTTPISGLKTMLEKLCAQVCKLPFPPPKSCHCNQGTKFGSWS
ncbi:hypothetical protein ACJMK2_022390 [Sinanodonta woodiana]|uniref:Uncharacterized protein n=1 Tax=Sinanodonta woodiana TaxID=1069815 RepID=A0ABD3TJQ0_SINWO